MSFWEQMGISPCAARKTCEFIDTAGCSYTCYQYHALNKLLEYSNLPTKYREDIPLVPSPEDREEFIWLAEFRKNIKYHVENGHGLYLWSPNKGNGKTTWASKMMLTYFNEIAEDFGMDRSRGIYVNVPEFIENLKDGFNDKDLSDDMLILKDRLRRADIVIWDDIGTEMPKEWVKQLLYSFINFRYSNSLTQVFTSNCGLEELITIFNDDRIADRIYEQCKPIRFYGESGRENSAWWNIK